jgi:MerR family transcriptional regulator, light-induced transcriptional regulator
VHGGRRDGEGYRAQVKVMDSLDELWAGIEAFDEDAADRALVGLLWDVPLGEALTLVVVPFLTQLGDRWEDGRLSVAHEHFASNLLRRRLGALAHQREALFTPGHRRPRVLLACPPGERHDLMLLCFSLLLSEQGWRTLFLGADTPVTALVSAARTAGADAVVLAATRPTALTAHSSSLARLAQDHPVYVAGRGADEEVAKVVGGRLLARDLVEAVDQLAPREPARRQPVNG